MKSLLLLLTSSLLLAQSISFSKAKRIVKKIYKEHPYTLHCEYNFQVDRPKRVVWRYIIPAEEFGSHLECWHTGDKECRHCSGRLFKERTCCKKVDTIYNKMEADMHNIFPILAQKSSTCQNEALGVIARVYLYFHKEYNLPLTQNQLQTYQVWDKNNPASEWEIQRNKMITKIQGNANPFIPQ